MANELHTMPLKIERLLSSANVQSLELDEFGAYMKLLCHTWLNKGMLPGFCLSSAQATSKLLGCNVDDMPRIKEKVIDLFFIVGDDGKGRNDTLSKLYEDVYAYSNERRDSGRKGGMARVRNQKQLENGSSSAQAELKQSLSIQSQSQSQSQIINTEYLSGAISSPPDQTTASAPLLNLEIKAKAKRFDNLIDFDWSIGDWREAIPEDVLSDWRGVYPACNVGWECNKAAMWLRANPTKRKKNYYRFLTGWMARCQESGGTK